RDLIVTGVQTCALPILPRILGVLMVLAGLSYVLFLSPPLARSLQPYILVFPGVGQISLTLWLLVMGVSEQRWKEQAGIAREWARSEERRVGKEWRGRWG